MRRVSLVVLVVLVIGAALALRSGRSHDGRLSMGKRIYEEGILPSGLPLQGVAQVATQRAGADAACVSCHRRSGFGGSEGTLEIKSITGPALFGKEGVDQPTAKSPVALARSARSALLTGTRQRPAYDDASLARVLREGVDVTGRKLNPGMPRYELDDEALASLTAYLKTLSATPSPGISNDTIHFATVIQPGVDPEQRRAMLEILEAFIKDTNAGMQSDLQQERAGYTHLGRKHRLWALHVWELTGASETWGSQLEAWNKQQPAFALIGGLGNASWRPIHEFSERFEVPCIFPLTDLPVLADPGNYTVYFSRGMALEAEALAKHLQSQSERVQVTQIFRRDDASSAAAEAFRKAWGPVGLQEIVVDGVPDKALWQKVSAEAQTLVLWLPPNDLADAQALTQPGSQLAAIYLSSTLSSGKHSGLADDRVRLIYPEDLPQLRVARLQTVKQWLRAKGITLSDEKVQMNTFLAVTVTAQVMSHSMDTLSRDFLLERLEHVVGNSFAPTIYPRLSLGPGQRFASKGSYITRDDEQLSAVSEWIVP